MKFQKKIGIIIIMLTLSSTLQAMMGHRMSHSNSIISEQSFEDLSQEQNEMIMDLRGEFVQKEIEINREIRRLRMEHHRCMRREEIDLEDYQRIEKDSKKLVEKRGLLQKEYNKQLQELIEKF